MSKLLQVFPGGQCYLVEGDTNGPDWKIKNNSERDKKARWRKPTDTERFAIRCQELAEIYVERDVLLCQSALVSDMLQKSIDGFSYEDIEHLRPDPSDWDAVKCLEWLADHTGERNYAARAADWKGEVERFAKHEETDPDEWEETATEELREAVNERAEDAEIYEWWLVTDWLADKLRSIGEPILDNNYGTWWGRTCTGQGMIMDGTLQRVALQFVD